eukprot:1124621_1
MATINLKEQLIVNDDNCTDEPLNALSLPPKQSLYAQIASSNSWNTLSITLCFTYIILQTAMPFYNKIALELYAYPITSCFFQVTGVVVVLLIIACIIHYIQNKLSPFKFLQHFFCDKYFKLKCKYLILPSLFFSCNIILTNIGIKLTSIDLHILLRATEIVWFVLLGPLLTKDRPTKHAIIAAFIVTIGSVSLAFSTIDSDNISFEALIINIASAFFTPLQIIFLRRATNKLIALKTSLNNDGVLATLSRDETMELTCLKMLLSLIFIFPPALIVEKPKAFSDITANYGTVCNVNVLVLGMIITLLMQWNVVALTSKVEPLIIGTLQQSKGVWVYIVSWIVGGAMVAVCSCHHALKCGKDYPSCPCYKDPEDAFHGEFAAPHIVGVICIVLGMIYYTVLKYYNKTVTQLE